MPIPDYIRQLRAKVGHDLIMMPAASAVIFNDKDEVLLQLRSDNQHWSLPGGAVEPGEEVAEAVIREVEEETGLQVIPERIVGIYGGKSHLHQYPNGDQVAIIVVTFVCRVLGGELRLDDDETLELRYFPVDALPDSLLQRHRQRLQHALTREIPFFALPEIDMGGAEDF